MATRIILDNGGGLVLQLGGWAHIYEGSSNERIAAQAATDIREWIKTGTTARWEGNDKTLTNLDELAQHASTDVVTIDRDVDTAASLAAELRATEGAMAMALADALASEMGRKRMSTLTAEERKALASKAARARWAAHARDKAKTSERQG